MGTVRRLNTAAARRLALALLGACVGGGCAHDGGARTDPARLPEITLELYAMGTLETTTPLDERPVGGLSGLAYREGVWAAVSDDVNDPRAYTLTMTFDAEAGTIEATVVSVHALPDGFRDAEGISHDVGDGWLIADEAPPAVVRTIDACALRDVYTTPANILANMRPNLTFESVTLRRAGRSVEVWAAMEGAIRSDGERADTAQGSLCRVVVFDHARGVALREHLYKTLPAPSGMALPSPFNPQQGLVALEALEDGRILALERGVAAPAGYQATIRLIEPGHGEDDVRHDLALAGTPRESLAALRVRTLANLSDLGASVHANFEGMAMGPAIDDERGGRLLVLIADDNFGRDLQRGRAIVALRLRLVERE